MSREKIFKDAVAKARTFGQYKHSGSPREVWEEAIDYALTLFNTVYPEAQNVSKTTEAAHDNQPQG